MALSVRFALRIIAACFLATCFAYAGAHPVRVDASTNCLECHGDHPKGDHVHPAVMLGCLSCHSIENRTEGSDVVLKSREGTSCFDCHTAETFSFSHFPYSSGMCTRCHDPHASANPKLLRAKVNDLCLSCHLRTPDSVPSRYMPTILLTLNNSMGHPYERHPVSGSRDPLSGGEISCVSCHLAHGGMKAHLLKMASAVPEDAMNQNTETKDMCRKCHLLMWGLDGVSTHKKDKKKGK